MADQKDLDDAPLRMPGEVKTYLQQMQTSRIDRPTYVKESLRILAERLVTEHPGGRLLGAVGWEGDFTEVIGALIEYVGQLEERIVLLELGTGRLP